MLHRVSTSLLVFAVAICVAGVTQPAPAQDQVEAQAIALQVVAPSLNEAEADMAPMNVAPGTTVTVLLRPPGEEKLVAIDDDASDVTAFTDSEGANLLEEPQRTAQDGNGFGGMSARHSGPIGAFPDISDDGTLAAVELTAPSAPTQGAATVNIEGTLVARVASGSKKHTLDSTALEAGQLDVPGHQLQITEVGPSQWGNSKVSVSIKTSSDTAEQLAGVRFLDDNGEPIKSRRLSRMTMMNTATLEYGLQQEVDAATIEFTFHDQMREVEVPIEMQVSLGL